MKRYLPLVLGITCSAAAWLGWTDLNRHVDLPEVDPPVASTASPAAAVQREPPALPAGEFCETPGHSANPVHPCSCHRVDYDRLCEGDNLTHDPACEQYCHEDHCHCVSTCEPH